MSEQAEQVRGLIEDKMRLWNRSVEEAAREVRPLIADPELVDQAIGAIREAARRRLILKVPRGVDALEYQYLVGEARRALWYTGKRETDRHWPALEGVLRGSGFNDGAMEDIDRASESVVGRLSDPGIHGLSKKGLVVGFVQSGKTANYSSVIAKAADAGFRLFIILAGIHNALRCQTQRRLVHDIIEPYPVPWFQLTTVDRDFGSVSDGAGLLSARQLRNLVVIKKNASRLRRLRNWLRDIPQTIRERCPAILIDDEADQATPNTKAAQNAMSAINRYIREIFELLPTATYVGYTATPFANVFMDPASDDLYPEDFIKDLPRPSGYFGAEQLFGRDAIDDADDPLDGLDMIRPIPSEEAAALKPPSGKGDRGRWDPPIQSSLRDALLWFALTLAAREARGQGEEHASMLVHTTHYQQVHFVLAEAIRAAMGELGGLSQQELDHELEGLWSKEVARVPARLFDRSTQRYEDLRLRVKGALSQVRVIVDNGASPDRLDYTAGPQKVIAVGGNTLSRGLTLEGLVVSYFIRTVNTYDTLLQMGRWFGFRKGYEDLPRIWMTDDLRDRFRYLATVEEEIRQDMRRYEREGVTPRQLGLRVRQHPLMAITAAGKMHLARTLKASYGGRRFQTFHFDRSDGETLRANLDAGRELIAVLLDDGLAAEEVEAGRWVLRGVRKSRVIDFLGRYRVSSTHEQLQPELTVNYLRQRDDARAEFWNVAVIGSSMASHRVGDRQVTFGPLELGLPKPVHPVNRARLKGTDHPADIKALMSRRDRIVDLENPQAEWKDLKDEELQDLRVKHADGRGLLLLYPISRHSEPMGVALRAGSREPMDAAEDILGMGIVFPEPTGVDGTSIVDEVAYVGLPSHLLEGEEAAPDEAEESLLAGDDEPDAQVSGAERLSQLPE